MMMSEIQTLKNSLVTGLTTILFAAWIPSTGFAQQVGLDPIKSGDRIRVEVFNEAALSGAFEVTSTGTINFPLLGKLIVSGKTVDQVNLEIEARLEQDYIRDAQVSVDMAGRRAQSLKVIGQVANPGEMQFEAGVAIDLFTAVTSAGGPTAYADTRRIELKRHVEGEITGVLLNLDLQKSYALRDGDMVIVPAKPEVKEIVAPVQTFTVRGHVKKPGIFELPKIGQLNILTAIAKAGDFSQLARPSKVTVHRQTAGEMKVIELNVKKMEKGDQPPFIIIPDDIITVHESIF